MATIKTGSGLYVTGWTTAGEPNLGDISCARRYSWGIAVRRAAMLSAKYAALGVAFTAAAA